MAMAGVSSQVFLNLTSSEVIIKYLTGIDLDTNSIKCSSHSWVKNG
jgi:hypothetical protein